MSEKTECHGGRSPLVLGFLSVLTPSEVGFVGGYLVLNDVGRPLEFHCTTPVKPTRAQEILYGTSLKPYLFAEAIAPALAAKAKNQAALICVDQRELLDFEDPRGTPVAGVFPTFNGGLPDAASPNALSPAAPSPGLASLDADSLGAASPDAALPIESRLLSPGGSEVDGTSPKELLGDGSSAVRVARGTVVAPVSDGGRGTSPGGLWDDGSRSCSALSSRATDARCDAALPASAAVSPPTAVMEFARARGAALAMQSAAVMEPRVTASRGWSTCNGLECREAMFGRNRLVYAAHHHPAIHRLLADRLPWSRALDLSEPFMRIRAAIEEALRRG